MAHGRIHDTVDVGRAVRHVRTTRNLTQTELAAKLGVSQRWLSELETGKPKLLGPQLFTTLTRLGIRLTWDTEDE